MNRAEFCDMIAKAKLDSGIRTTDLSFALQMLLPTLRRFEKGEHNFSIGRAIDYLRVVGHKIVLVKDTTMYDINAYEDVIEWMVSSRKPNYSQRKLADLIGITYVNLANIEKGKTALHVDMFLQMANVFGCQVFIQPINAGD